MTSAPASTRPRELRPRGSGRTPRRRRRGSGRPRRAGHEPAGQRVRPGQRHLQRPVRPARARRGTPRPRRGRRARRSARGPRTGGARRARPTPSRRSGGRARTPRQVAVELGGEEAGPAHLAVADDVDARLAPGRGSRGRRRRRAAPRGPPARTRRAAAAAIPAANQPGCACDPTTLVSSGSWLIGSPSPGLKRTPGRDCRRRGAAGLRGVERRRPSRR